MIESIRCSVVVFVLVVGHTVLASDNDINEHSCPICLDSLVDNSITLEHCRHEFHSVCMQPWVKDHNTCPLCREVMQKTFNSFCFVRKKRFLIGSKTVKERYQFELDNLRGIRLIDKDKKKYFISYSNIRCLFRNDHMLTVQLKDKIHPMVFYFKDCNQAFYASDGVKECIRRCVVLGKNPG